MVRRFLFSVLVVLLLASVVSCGGSKEVNSEATPLPAVSPTATGTAAAPTPELQPTPTAGEANGFILPAEGIRPIAVMIDNEGTRSLPQGGLDQAQVIYEIIVEGGETRLMPLFWGVSPQMIGSVRSSRHYFLDYSMENDAIYVHFGWSPMAKSDISTLKINNINGVSNGGEIFWDLTKDKGNWQDSYTSMQNISDFIKKVKYRTTTDKKVNFSYNRSYVEPVSDKQAGKITVRYSGTYTCGYEYDSLTKSYMRFRKGEPQIERVTGKQLAAANIIIQFTDNYTIKGDKAGRQEVRTVGSGKGYFITYGKAVSIKWSKSDRRAPTKYTDDAGNPILLNPGQTWIQVVPVNGRVTFG